MPLAYFIPWLPEIKDSIQSQSAENNSCQKSRALKNLGLIMNVEYYVLYHSSRLPQGFRSARIALDRWAV